MRRLQIILAVTGVAAALAGAVLAQQRDDRGHPPPTMSRGMGRGEFPAGGRGAYEPPRPGGYGRGGPMYGSPTRSIAPPYGRGGPAYPQQRYGPPPGYGAYPPSYGGSPAFGGQWRDQQDFLREGVRQGQLAPLGRVIGSIRQHTPGRQLDAGLEYQGARLVYRVRWMTENGRRVDYIVDAATGAIVSGR